VPVSVSVARTGHALGIALSMSGGTKAAIVERTLTKRLQTAFVARAGVQAALLASRGVTGPAQWLTGPYGWFAVYEAGTAAAVTDGLGERFVFTRTGIKKFPCCLCSHAAIDATLALVRENALAVDDIDEMAVTISPYMARIVGAPYAPSRDAQVTAQFSVQYAVACAASKQRFTLAEIEEDVCLEPSLVARAQRIAVDTDPDWPGETAPARVTLRPQGRAPLVRRVDALPGTAANPMSAAELDAKFTDCLGRGAMPLSKAQAAAMIDRCRALVSLQDVRALLDTAAAQRMPA
jgi:2-methylcitrate dehydratase PrpD